MKRVLCINTGGSGDLRRARYLTTGLNAEVTFCDVDRARKRLDSARQVRRMLHSGRWDLAYHENTGIAGGMNLIAEAGTRRLPYIVSSGDPVAGYFRATRGPLHGALLGAYERLLYRSSAGFVGWTPYLTGRALQMGAPRGVTVEGGVDPEVFRPFAPGERAAARERFGFRPDDLVLGVVGSLNWSARQSYCYGLELVESLQHSERNDLALLIVGDGTGREGLERRVPQKFATRVRFTGRLPEADVVTAINALDIGFVTQTLDGLGSYRLTTKLPEYLACGRPVAMSPVPGFDDYAGDAGWPLPPFHPASPEFHRRLACWLDTLPQEEIAAKAANARDVALRHFDYRLVGRKFRRFVHRLLYEE